MHPNSDINIIFSGFAPIPRAQPTKLHYIEQEGNKKDD
jgi:hypothetical protein